MTRPEQWLRRVTVVFVCAALIVTSMWVMIVLFRLVMPAP